MIVRVATRTSPLARWQAETVADMLRAVEPDVEIEFVARAAEGDRRLDVPISEIGGKGVFSKEIQALVLEGAADLAVHSAKDLQAITPDGLDLVAVPPRGDARDALVGARLEDLPEGATVGTGSARRAVQLRRLRPDLTVTGIRGNIATRLGRLDGDEPLAAIVMAAAALERLGIDDRVVDLLEPDVFVPQVGQGTLAVECRTGDDRIAGLLRRIDDDHSHRVFDVERAFLRRLGGDCDLPAGAHAVLVADHLTITGVLADGDRLEEHRVAGDVDPALGVELADELRARLA